MGIISPRDGSPASKALFTCLVIILSPFLIVAVLVYLLWGAILYLAIWLAFRKQFAVFVYSNSPTWKDYIESEILPGLGEHAVILNWSERRNWKPSLPVLAFRTFGGYRNFNPLGIVIHPFRFAKTYRFFEAFQEFKHGDSRKVEKVKSELFEVLRI
jgi:hypothetical protein